MPKSLILKNPKLKILEKVITKKVKIPSRDVLENFFMAILTKFSTFEASNRFFRQSSGVSMGGKMSSLANIFCHMSNIGGRPSNKQTGD